VGSNPTPRTSNIVRVLFKENSGVFHPAETIVTLSAGFVTALAAISVFNVTKRKKKPMGDR
jgi:hypothetical protein